jgi:hypothetical protein
MSRLHYFADGFLLEKEGPNRQSTWVCMFNPVARDAKLRFTFYYENAEPTSMDCPLPARRCVGLHLLSCREVLRDQRFGAKIESSEPAVVQVTTGYYGVADRPDWYTHAMHSVLCGDRLAKVLYYADALVIDNPGKRLKEPEWAFILNPNREAAAVTLHAHFPDGVREYSFCVPPERLLPVFMDDLVPKNRIFGAKYVSSVPVAIQQTRWIMEEDRKTIRACFSVMAKPEPLPWQDDVEIGAG